MGKLIAIGVALLVILIALIACFSGLVGKNDYADYQIKQSIGGDVIVIDTPGWYNRGFGTIYTYPRSVQAFYSKDVHEGGQADESIPVNFNDGGRAQVSVMVQFQMPSDADRRKKLHQTFGNVDAIKQAVRAHLINCVKNAGPMMSATENQAARKGEFNQVVEEQLRNGIYAMRRVEVELKDHATAAATTQSADNGSLSQPVRVMATEIVLDEKGQPVIVEPSPLKDYGITILQFSITGTDYDDATTNGLVFWTEEEIKMRKLIEDFLVLKLTEVVKTQNRGFEFVQVEAPVLTPRHVINQQYSDDDIYVVADGLALRPETTLGSFLAAKELLDPYRTRKFRLPLVVWQHGKSFRREQDQPSKHMRLKEFYQLEFQIMYSRDTKNDYGKTIVPAVNTMIQTMIGLCHTEPSDRLPSYSEETIDVICDATNMEVCSISKRTDFDAATVLEVAVGTDRCVYNMMKGE